MIRLKTKERIRECGILEKKIVFFGRKISEIGLNRVRVYREGRERRERNDAAAYEYNNNFRAYIY